MLRIITEKRDSRDLIRVCGRLEAEYVSELEKIARKFDRSVTLDASELASADSSGMSLLGILRAEGMEIVGLNGYLSERLRQILGDRDKT